jgi:hypothetical protein
MELCHGPGSIIVKKKVVMKKVLSVCVVSFLVLCSCSRSDHDKPDSKANRDGFAKWLGVMPDQRVSNVFFYSDEWGGDAKYWFAFSASQDVIDRIIQHLGLKPDFAQWDEGNAPSADDFPWWDASERNKLKFFKYEDTEKEILYRLWYDPKTQKCQCDLTFY